MSYPLSAISPPSSSSLSSPTASIFSLASSSLDRRSSISTASIRFSRRNSTFSISPPSYASSSTYPPPPTYTLLPPLPRGQIPVAIISPAREQAIRAKLEPLLFPAPRPLGKVLKSLLLSSSLSRKKTGSLPKKQQQQQRENGVDELSEEEKRIAEAMVREYWENIDRLSM